jgi:hypothetical protein
MAVPTAYTEDTLAEYMHSALREVATTLGFAPGDGDYDEAVNEALLAYGVTDIAEATQIAKLRTLARREAWRQAQSAAAARFDFSADGGDYSRSQLHKQITTNLERAEADAAPYATVAYRISRKAIRFNDAYSAASEGADL